MNRFDLWVGGQEFSDGSRVRRVSADSTGQRLDAANDEPAVERGGDRPTRGLYGPDTLEEFVVFSRNQRPTCHVAMTTQVLRRGVHDEIGTERERLLRDGGRPRVVDRATRARVVRNRRDPFDVGYGEQWIGRRLDPDETGRGTQRSDDIVGVLHV